MFWFMCYAKMGMGSGFPFLEFIWICYCLLYCFCGKSMPKGAVFLFIHLSVICFDPLAWLRQEEISEIVLLAKFGTQFLLHQKLDKFSDCFFMYFSWLFIVLLSELALLEMFVWYFLFHYHNYWCFSRTYLFYQELVSNSSQRGEKFQAAVSLLDVYALSLVFLGLETNA